MTKNSRGQLDFLEVPYLLIVLLYSLSISKVGNFGNIFLFYQYLRSRSVVNHKTYVGHASFTG